MAALVPTRLTLSSLARSVVRSLATTAASPAQTIAAWTRPYTPGLLSKKELEQFWQDGFVTKHHVFDPAELEPCMRAIDKLVDGLAQRLHRGGKIKDLCADAGFHERLTLLEKQFPSCSVLLHKHGVLPPAVQKLWTSKPLMSAATQVLGDDLAGHPVWNLRCKTPNQEEATVPWHQDAAYLDPRAWNVLQLTAWIPMVDATVKNGCMQMMRGGHRSGHVAQHTCCWGNTWYVDLPLDEMRKSLALNPDKDLVTCEVPLGSVLFLNNLIPHRSLNNFSNQIRWSFDLRWQKPTEPTGFEGIKDAIPLKKANNPSFVVDWEGWAGESRTPGQASTGKVVELTEADFDTTISGPWMGQWPITHHNRHTRTYDVGQSGVKGWHKA